ncbi:MAG: hypothetical protein AAB131_12220 [Actinomycetota bacterium]
MNIFRIKKPTTIFLADGTAVCWPNTFQGDRIDESMLDGLLKEGVVAFESNSPGKVVEEVAKKPAINPDGKGKWRVDPATLSGRTLEQLNVQLKEIDATVEPFDSIEEATAFLTQDFATPPPA